MLRRRRPPEPIPPLAAPAPLVQVCHPDWRGVRAAAEGFGSPVLALRDLAAPGVIPALQQAGTRRVVIQGWPPGAAALAASAATAGIAVAAVSHASPAQHGTDPGEAEAVAAGLRLLADGILDRFGFVKAGMVETFAGLGHRTHHVPNRTPQLAAVAPVELGPGLHCGVFFHPYWRKNVATQVMAARLLGATAHVMHRPAVPYLGDEGMVEHGELPRSHFLPLLAGVAINLHVTLAESHPVTPMESYLLGVPCLISPTSALFADQPDLATLTVVAACDDPTAIAAAARRLLQHRDEAVGAAREWLARADRVAAAAWEAFTA